MSVTALDVAFYPSRATAVTFSTWDQALGRPLHLLSEQRDDCPREATGEPGSTKTPSDSDHSLSRVAQEATVSKLQAEMLRPQRCCSQRYNPAYLVT